MAEEKSQDLPTGLYWKGKKTEVDRVVLPFQTIETINESRATREKDKEIPLVKDQQPKYSSSWYNRLIWGDNKYIMASLLEEFAGKIDLIYIDPPFATGADFSVKIEVGDVEWTKEPSAIEDKAYRDTWGKGLNSYLQMMYERLLLMRELLSEKGSIYVHLDYRLVNEMKIVLDEIFGTKQFCNLITWRRQIPRGMKVYAKYMPYSADYILLYIKSEDAIWKDIEKETLITIKEAEEKYMKDDKGYFRTSDPGTYSDESLIKLNSENRIYVSNSGKLVVKNGKVSTTKGTIGVKYYREIRGNFVVEKSIVDNIWDDIPGMGVVSSEYIGYPTQKPKGLLERIIKASSADDSIVADFFCGSGTTGAVAEKLGRRWLMTDLGRFAIHTARKRLLDIEDCRPFVVQNLGKYERQYWQGVTFAKRSDEQVPIYEYIQFILKLYNAEPISGMLHIHGKRGKCLVHVGAVDAPVTLSEIQEAIAETKKAGQNSLDILGWEWEMGLHDVVEKESKSSGIHLRLFSIPRDVMDPRAVEKGDVTFYELAYLEAEAKKDKYDEFVVELQDFAIPNLDLIPQEVREKIKKWSDYIDYWAVDWNWNQDTFHNMWQSYRTRKERNLELKSDGHKYESKGKHLIMIKVIDIFGNDTTRILEVKS